jgi:hypothetical protein
MSAILLMYVQYLAFALQLPSAGRYWEFGTHIGPTLRYRFACQDDQQDLNGLLEFSIALPARLSANRDSVFQ